MIQPEFTIELDDVIYTGRHRGVDKMDDNAIISWVFFGLAVLILGAMAIMYWVMKCRKRKMQLQQALAEGKISLKELDEDDGDHDFDSPD